MSSEATTLLIRYLKQYSMKIHRIARNAIQNDISEPIRHIQCGLWMNPIHHNLIRVCGPITCNEIIHVPLLDEPDIGVSSKAILWPPGSESDTHYHPHIHCFFTPIHRGLQHSVTRDDPHYGDSTRFGFHIRPGNYVYIHDSIGPHQLTNVSSSKSVMSYHLYIQEDGIGSFPDKNANYVPNLPSSSANTDADLFWYGTRA